MKASGYKYTLLVLLWLIFSIAAYTQPTQHKDQHFPGIRTSSQMLQLPEDLINPRIKSLNNIHPASRSEGEDLIMADSIIYYSSLELSIRETYAYDLQGRITTIHKETWGPSGWMHSELSTFTYDLNGNLLSELKKQWVLFGWQSNYLLSYTYDMAGNMTSWLIQHFDQGQWINNNLIIYTYDENRALLTSLEQTWETEKWDSGTWENSSYTENQYDDRGYLFHSLRYSWINESWQFAMQTHSEYNDQGYLLTALTEAFYGEIWHPNILKTFTYDAQGNNLTYYERFWSGTEWINYTLMTRSFDYNGNLLSELSQEWLNTWNNISNSEFTYDADGNCQQALWFTWDGNAWANSNMAHYEYTDGVASGNGFYWGETGWVRGDAMIDLKWHSPDGSYHQFCEWWGSRADVYFSALYTGTPDQDGPDGNEISIFPNPASERVNLNINLPETLLTTIQIYNSSGMLMMEKTLQRPSSSQDALDLNVSRLPAGHYFIVVSGPDTRISKQFSIIR